jgi:cytoskeleton protein RodZ
MRVDLKATEPTWVSFVDADGKKLLVGLLVAGDVRTFQLTKPATLRAGNAGGITVRLDGKPLGPIGFRGYVREIEFKDGNFKLTTIQ